MKKLKSNTKRLSSIQRVLELIRLFNTGKTLCIDTLLTEPLWSHLSERTLKRDLGLINEVYPDFFYHLDGTSGCYKAITNDMFDNIVTPQKMALIIQTFQIAKRNKLYKDLSINKQDIKLIERFIAKTEENYIFKSKPYENHITDTATFKKLEHIISYRKEITMLFPMSDGDTKTITVRAYKILYMNENFYLACERTDKKQTFSRYRISRIISIEETGKTFKRAPDIEDFIVALQTQFAEYKPPFRKHLISVELEADLSILRYFQQKQYLPSQKIEINDASFSIYYTVSAEREVEAIIKQWIPLIKVVNPTSLKEKIHKDLSTYL